MRGLVCPVVVANSLESQVQPPASSVDQKHLASFTEIQSSQKAGFMKKGKNRPSKARAVGKLAQ